MFRRLWHVDLVGEQEPCKWGGGHKALSCEEEGKASRPSRENETGSWAGGYAGLLGPFWLELACWARDSRPIVAIGPNLRPIVGLGLGPNQNNKIIIIIIKQQ